jgi:hypothetical protein
MRIGGAAIAAAGLCLFLSACSGGFTTVAAEPPGHYTSLGPTSGTACGTLMVLATAYNFIPIKLNDRVARARATALANVPGATGLIDVSVKEDWYWWVLGTARCTTVSGEAIK